MEQRGGVLTVDTFPFREQSILFSIHVTPIYYISIQCYSIHGLSTFCHISGSAPFTFSNKVNDNHLYDCVKTKKD